MFSPIYTYTSRSQPPGSCPVKAGAWGIGNSTHILRISLTCGTGGATQKLCTVLYLSAGSPHAGYVGYVHVGIVTIKFYRVGDVQSLDAMVQSGPLKR